MVIKIYSLSLILTNVITVLSESHETAMKTSPNV